ncbi:hypothetical protein [Elizabethkingia anophelis]|uniref:hypothetical protein n=1 Tax=Elizabethkingia anophelis TaxID=1117645 RepID=UPI0021A3318C|nr:hypothetical protein [Elizabethkingia anophelis]MCT4042868.1 hypothetical protein [Elizabethkingia anophelis]
MAQIPITVHCGFILNGNDTAMFDLKKKLDEALSKEDYTLAHELKCKIDNLKYVHKKLNK